jgi:molybdopterin converting factor small subunit
MVGAAYRPESTLQLELADGAVVEQVLVAAGLAGRQEHLVVLLAGRAVDLEQPVHDGDALVILPRLAGG